MREKKNPQSLIIDYQIDHRLKVEKDYPLELSLLVREFRTRDMGFLPPHIKEKMQSYGQQISLVERTFREYFLHNTAQKITIIETVRAGKKEAIQDPKDIEKEAKRIKYIDPIHVNCIRRVNAKLKYFTPQLLNDGVAYKLEPFTLESKKDQFGEAILWAWLAATIDSKGGLNPELVHECLYCKKIFFSRQRKKFHPECQSKLFSEKSHTGRHSEEAAKRLPGAKKEKCQVEGKGLK